jgi:hypothetical protein
MKNRIIALVVGMVLLVFSFLFAQSPDTLWTRTYGGSNVEYGFSVCETTDSGYVFVGRTHSFGNDIYIVRTNIDGDTIWTRAYGRYGLDSGYSVIQCQDSGFVIAGGTYIGAVQYIYILKVNADGDSLWANIYGGVGYASSVCQAPDGGYAIAGEDTSGAFLLKIDSNGDSLWMKSYGGFFASSIQPTPEGGFILTGCVWESLSESRDVYLIKTDASGDSLWTRACGWNNDDAGLSVKVTDDSGYIITGWMYQSFDECAHLVKTDSGGNVEWDKIYRSGPEQTGESVQQTADGGYIIAGHKRINSQHALLVIKTDSIGDTLWTRTYDGPEDDWGEEVVIAADSSYVIVGWTASFGGGICNVWLLKMSSSVNIAESDDDNEFGFSSLKFTAFPNPFTRATIITLHGESGNPSTYAPAGQNGGGFGGFRIGETAIHIYDVSGRRVREISLLPFSFLLGAKATWDGCDENGNVVAPGVYFLKLNNKPVGKVVKVR